MNKPHYVSFHKRPRQGSAWLETQLALNYTHTILARGGDDSAAFSLQLSKSEAEHIFANRLGCVVKITVDNPEEPIWEGVAKRITYHTGGVAVSRGLENMSNRVNVTFYNADSGAATKTENTTPFNNAESQAIYGLKEGSYDAGIHFNNADKTHKVYLRNLLGNIYSWPQVSVAASEHGDGLIEIECEGLQYYCWDWQQYYLAKTDVLATTTDLVTAFLRVTGNTTYGAGVLVPANAPLVYKTGPSGAGQDWIRYVKVGAAPANISLASEGGQTYLQYLQGLVEAGDGTNRFAFGITKVDPAMNARYVYYNYANTAIKYTAYAHADPGRLRDIYGQVVPGWLVKPDAGVRINDLLSGWDQAGDDPRIGYIEAITYTAEDGRVSWQTGDDITLEGAMQRRNKVKKIKANDPFAAKRNTL